MTGPSSASNYWHDKNRDRQRVRTQRQRGAGQRTGTPVGQRSTQPARPSQRGRRDPGPPSGRGRLEGTTHAVRRGPTRGQRIKRRLRKSLRPRRPNIRQMMRRHPMGLAWGTGTLLLTSVLMIAQVSAWGIYSATSLGVTTIVGVAEARRDRATAPPASARPRQAQKRTQATRPPRAGGSPTRKPPGKTGGKVCGENCKRSPAAKSTCRCKAPDCKHGSLAGTP